MKAGAVIQNRLRRRLGLLNASIGVVDRRIIGILVSNFRAHLFDLHLTAVPSHNLTHFDLKEI